VPTVDERLQELLAAAAVEPTAGDVLGAVTHKRHQRHTRRVVRNIGAAIVAVVVIAGSLAWLTADQSSRPTIAPAGARGDAWLSARPVALEPDVGYVRGPLIASGEYVALATYDRNGTGFKVPPSHVVRIDATGRVLDEVELQGEILSLADGEGARWVVTHDADNVANPQYRVKRIDANGTVLSNAFPPGVEPTGPVVAAGGAAWVPVEHGVLRFDPATGAYTSTVAAPDPDRIPRVVAVGARAYAYSVVGSKLVDLAATAMSEPTVASTDVELLGVAATPVGAWVLTQTAGRTVIAPLDPSTGISDRARAVQLPKRFHSSDLQASGNTLWVRGAFADSKSGLARVDVRNDGHAVVGDPVMLRVPTHDDVLGLGRHDVLVAADGELYRVDVR